MFSLRRTVISRAMLDSSRRWHFTVSSMHAKAELGSSKKDKFRDGLDVINSVTTKV